MHSANKKDIMTTELMLLGANIPEEQSELDLSDIRITDNRTVDQLRDILARIPRNITTLILKRNDLGRTDPNRNHLFGVIKNLSTTVTTLDLSQNNLNNMSTEYLNSSFNKLSENLSTLILSDNNFGAMNTNHLCAVISNLQYVASLDLSTNNLGSKTDAELISLFESIPETVTTLNLSQNNLMSKTDEELIHIFKKLPVTVTTVHFSEDEDRLTRLKNDAMSILENADDALTNLEQSFNQDPNANTLDWSQKNIGDMDPESLCLVIHKIPSHVTTLNWSQNNLNTRNLFNLLKEIPSTVTSLNLSQNNLGHMSLDTLITHLPKTVTTLNLSQNNITNSSGLAQLFENIPPNITTLDLSQNKLDFKQEKLLIDAFRKLPPTVSTLNFGPDESQLTQLFTRVQNERTGLDKINQLLDKYLTQRKEIKDSSGKTKEYFYGSFFACFQKSYTQKKEAVEALKDVLNGGKRDIAPYLSVLRNGTLGDSLRAFIKSGQANILIGKNVNTVTEFVEALQENKDQLTKKLS